MIDVPFASPAAIVGTGTDAAGRVATTVGVSVLSLPTSVRMVGSDEGTASTTSYRKRPANASGRSPPSLTHLAFVPTPYEKGLMSMTTSTENLASK